MFLCHVGTSTDLIVRIPVLSIYFNSVSHLGQSLYLQAPVSLSVR